MVEGKETAEVQVLQEKWLKVKKQLKSRGVIRKMVEGKETAEIQRCYKKKRGAKVPGSQVTYNPAQTLNKSWKGEREQFQVPEY